MRVARRRFGAVEKFWGRPGRRSSAFSMWLRALVKGWDCVGWSQFLELFGYAGRIRRESVFA
jgi:hypothetical protein